MLGIFHDSADVFVLKVCLFSFFFHSDVFSLPFFLNNLDLFLFSTVQKKKKKNEQDIEKLAPKRGVVLQAVKEVLQGLVDEDLVHCEKIGISNFFWYFFFFFLLFSVWSRGRRGDKEREKGRGKNSTLSFLFSLSLSLSSLRPHEKKQVLPFRGLRQAQLRRRSPRGAARRQGHRGRGR